ncbi:MAG TPA: ABC transporter substrate-binding protein [Polyangiaceae bacterium]|nr:ABC transporter substrate-binding protein [Polyangiaceae bacterium]
MRALLVSPVVALIAVAQACSQPSLSTTLFACSTNADCRGGDVCAPVNGARACLSPSQLQLLGDGGVQDGTADADTSPIQVGMTAVFSGTNVDLGTQMRRGIKAWFNAQNASGGIKGRQLVLVDKDDAYEPYPALLNTYALLDIPSPPGNPADCAADAGSATPNWQGAIAAQRDTLGPNRVVAMLGNVGTPTMLCTAPVAVRDHVVYFAPFTGAITIIRDVNVESPYLFNFRASYYDETAAMVAYLTQWASPRVTDYRHVVAFTQSDSYGATGYSGLYIAWNQYLQGSSQSIGPTDIKQVQYTRNQPQTVTQAITDATTYLQTIADGAAGADAGAASIGVGVVMVPTYQPAANFVKGVVDWQNDPAHTERLALGITFMSVSFVGADALATTFQSLSPNTYTDGNGQQQFYGNGVWVTQVVPYYNAQSPGVVQYRTDLATVDVAAPSWGSLEGYLGARLFAMGLLGAAPATDSDSLVAAYEAMSSVDLGIGSPIGFSKQLPDGHQASKNVWLSRVKIDSSGSTSFDVPFVYSPGSDGTRIRPNGG